MRHFFFSVDQRGRVWRRPLGAPLDGHEGQIRDSRFLDFFLAHVQVCPRASCGSCIPCGSCMHRGSCIPRIRRRHDKAEQSAVCSAVVGALCVCVRVWGAQTNQTGLYTSGEEAYPHLSMRAHEHYFCRPAVSCFSSPPRTAAAAAATPLLSVPPVGLALLFGTTVTAQVTSVVFNDLQRGELRHLCPDQKVTTAAAHHGGPTVCAPCACVLLQLLLSPAAALHAPALPVLQPCRVLSLVLRVLRLLLYCCCTAAAALPAPLALDVCPATLCARVCR